MIVQDLVTARGLLGRVELAKVIVTVDGVLGSSQLSEADEVTAQIAQADLCVITKCDVADLGQVHQLVDDIRAINPLAEIVTSDDERADPSALLDFSGTRLRGAGRSRWFPLRWRRSLHPWARRALHRTFASPADGRRQRASERAVVVDPA